MHMADRRLRQPLVRRLAKTRSWRRPHNGAKFLPAFLAVSRLVTLPLGFRPGLNFQEAIERLCIIIKQAALRRDVPCRREVSCRFTAHVGSLGGVPGG